MKKLHLRKIMTVAVSTALLLMLASCGKTGRAEALSEQESAKERQESSTAQQEERESDTAETDSTENGENTSAEMTDYFIAKLSSDAGVSFQDIRYYLVDDFDFDGKYEGFLFVGDEADPDWNACEGAIWFVNESKSRELQAGFSFALNEDSDIFSIIEGADKNFVAFNQAYATSDVTELFYVDGEACIESAVSGIGDAHVDHNTGDLVISVSAYDSVCNDASASAEPEWTGHTWKPYYFYYSRSTGDFMEYQAQEISAKELSDTVGTDLAAALRRQGYVVDNIIRRNNGILNVNYSEITKNRDGSTSVAYRNATYDERISDYVNAWGDDKTGVFASDYGGIYQLQITAGNRGTGSVLPDGGGDVYGVFVMSGKDADKCADTELRLAAAGFFDAQIIYTPDFSGLNPEACYAVSAGLYETEEEAQDCLEKLTAAGFKDAYVKLAGKYTGGKYLYTMGSPEEAELLKNCVVLRDVSVSLPYPVGAEATRMDLYVYEDARFSEDADMDSFGNYEKGDTPYQWLVKNHKLLKSAPDTDTEYGMALSGVFQVRIDGNKITEYYGSYWWD